MASNFDIIQQLMAAGKLGNGLAGSQAAETGSVPQPIGLATPAAPDASLAGPAVGPIGLAGPQAPAPAPISEFPINSKIENPVTPIVQNPVAGIKATMQDTNDAFRKQEEALRKQAEIGAKKAAEEAAYQKTLNDQLAAQDLKNQEIEANRQAQLKVQTDKMQRVQDEYATMKVDPGKFWAERSTPQKILTGIGLLMGAFGGGAENASVKIINDAINRDIDLQKVSIDKKGAELGQQKGLLVELRQQFGDARVAENTARAIMLDRASRELAQIGAKYSGEENQAKIEGVIGKLQADKNALLSQNYQTLENISQNRAQMAIQRENLQLNREMKQDARNAQMSQQEEKLQVAVDVPGPDGTMRQAVVLARDPEAAKKARESYSSAKSLVQTIDDAIAHRKSFGRSFIPGTEEAAQADALASQILVQIKDTYKLGALDNGVVIIGNKLAKNPGGMSAGVEKSLNTLREAVLKSANNRLKQYGDGIQIYVPEPIEDGSSNRRVRSSGGF